MNISMKNCLSNSFAVFMSEQKIQNLAHIAQRLEPACSSLNRG